MAEKPDPMQQASGQSPGREGQQPPHRTLQPEPDPMQQTSGQQPSQAGGGLRDPPEHTADPMSQTVGQQPYQSGGQQPFQQQAQQPPEQQMQQSMQDQSSEPGFNPPKPHEGLSALVFGASGITGYALMGALLNYPTPQTFARIIGLTNRPLSTEISQLPQDGRIEMYSGMDLLHREQSLAQLSAIPGIEMVTHVYFASYAGHGSSYEQLRQINELLLTNAVGGTEVCCPRLQFLTLQTGGKAYGVEFRDKVPYNPPLSESAPRIPDPYAQNIFYYPQYDIMTRASAGKPWTFCEIRPDAIIGFVPQNNAMNLAQALALFLSLWKEIEVEGGAARAVPFPGSKEAWLAPHTDTSQDILARFHIYASLRPDAVAGHAFNVADGQATTWEREWPRICEYFGLEGVGPENSTTPFSAQAWMESHQREWDTWVKKFGLREGALQGTSWDFMQAVVAIPFRRDYDLSKSRQIGFNEERPHYLGYYKCFDEMRKARIIP